MIGNRQDEGEGGRPSVMWEGTNYAAECTFDMMAEVLFPLFCKRLGHDSEGGTLTRSYDSFPPSSQTAQTLYYIAGFINLKMTTSVTHSSNVPPPSFEASMAPSSAPPLQLDSVSRRRPHLTQLVEQPYQPCRSSFRAGPLAEITHPSDAISHFHYMEPVPC